MCGIAWLFSCGIIGSLNYISEDFELFMGIQITLHIYFCLGTEGILQDQTHTKSISLAGAGEVLIDTHGEIRLFGLSLAWHCTQRQFHSCSSAPPVFFSFGHHPKKTK